MLNPVVMLGQRDLCPARGQQGDSETRRTNQQKTLTSWQDKETQGQSNANT